MATITFKQFWIHSLHNCINYNGCVYDATSITYCTNVSHDNGGNLVRKRWWPSYLLAFQFHYRLLGFLLLSINGFLPLAYSGILWVRILGLEMMQCSCRAMHLCVVTNSHSLCITVLLLRSLLLRLFSNSISSFLSLKDFRNFVICCTYCCQRYFPW